MAKILLEMKNITKTFPGVKALDDVNFQVEEGEIHALVGENGAGKSTLMNVLSGIYPHGTYEGDIIYDGEVCKFSNIKDSEHRGIVIIHQELALVPEMTIGENMYLGNEQGHKFAINWNKTYAEADRYLRMVGLSESSKVQVKTIGTGKQQLVEIAKALAKKARLLILDEPTSSLNEEDSRALLDLMLSFKKQGMTMIIITHKLNEVSYVADKITVLRDGSTIETIDNHGAEPVSEERIIKGMVGREMTNRFPKREGVKIGDVQMEVKDWTVHHPLYPERKVVDNVSMYVRKGEVVGIYGLMGAGRTELVESLMGLHPESSGTIVIEGETITKPNVTDQIARGMVLVPEDRQKDGLVQTMSISDNLLLTSIPQFTKNGVINKGQCREAVKKTVKDMQVKVADVKHLITSLSGGNQQKVVIGKCVMANAKIFMMDEPSRGIDVGAKTDIFILMRQFAAQGNGVIFVGSELKEIISVCDRVLVMSNGKLTADLTGDEITEDALVIASAANLHTGKAAKTEGSAT